MIKYLLLATLLGFSSQAHAASNTSCANGDVLIFDSFVGCMPANQRAATTIGALPICNAASRGKMYIVTDALAPVALAIVAAGGAIVVGVTCNGTSWIVQ